MGQVGVEPTMFSYVTDLQSAAIANYAYLTRVAESVGHEPNADLAAHRFNKRVSDLPSSLSVWLGWMDSNHRCRFQRPVP